MMNYFKNKLDDLREQMENNIPQWHKLIFRPLTLEEKEVYSGWTGIVDNLPDFDKDVLVTDGVNVWVDSFDIDDCVYL